MKSYWGVWVVLAGLVILIGFTVGGGFTLALSLGPESKAYVDRSVPEIVKSWNSQDLVDRASPDLLRAVSRAELDRVFRTSKQQLGRLKAYAGSWQENHEISLLTLRNPHATYLYLSEAVFEKGGATIVVGVTKRYGMRAMLGLSTPWEVTEFTVHPKGLIGADVETPAMRAARQARKDGARGRPGSTTRPVTR